MKDKKTQIKGNTKPIINDNLEQYVRSTNEKTTRELEPGVNATTLRPGFMYPIMIKEVLAGEYIEEWKINNLTRLLTPLAPSFDRSYISLYAYFVPYTAIWDDAEKLLAGTESDDYNPGILPYMIIPEETTKYSTYNQTLLSKYGLGNKSANTIINVLLLRGYRAISNAFWRNKDYSTAKIEWKDTVVTEAEKNNIKVWGDGGKGFLTGVNENTAYLLEKAPGRKGYLTNIKSKIAKTQVELQDVDQYVYAHLDWQTRFNDMKQRQDNINKNPWDIIAEMGGTQPVVNDRVQLLGYQDYEMNFQQITQSAPEIDNSSPLGTTGAFSYTKANGTLFSHKKFQQHGHIHIIACITTDNHFENGTPKELLKTQVDDIYRPGLAKKEYQLLMKQEISNNVGNTGSAAYQPAWAEYKRLPSWCSGQMQTKTLDIIAGGDDQYQAVSNSHWHNFKPPRNITINDNYFRPANDISKVFARNNILDPVDTLGWAVEPFLNMSEHRVKTSLPIEEEALTQNTKAETTY